MLADVGAGGGEGVVLADEPHGVGVAARVYQGDVAGDVHAGGAQGHAGHRVFQTSQAAMVEDMLLVVVPEALQTHQHQIGGVDADGAVRRVRNDLGGGLDPVQDLQLRLTLQHLPDHVGELGQADAAGHALAAGLGLAQIQKIQRHIHRAQARRAGGDPPLHIPVQLFHHGLGLAGHLYFQSAHLGSLLLVSTVKFSTLDRIYAKYNVAVAQNQQKTQKFLGLIKIYYLTKTFSLKMNLREKHRVKVAAVYTVISSAGTPPACGLLRSPCARRERLEAFD